MKFSLFLIKRVIGNIMLFSAVGSPTTSTGTLGGTTLGFGLKFPGAGGAMPVASSKILELLECVWMLLGNLLHNKQ